MKHTYTLLFALLCCVPLHIHGAAGDEKQLATRAARFGEQGSFKRATKGPVLSETERAELQASHTVPITRYNGLADELENIESFMAQQAETTARLKTLQDEVREKETIRDNALAEHRKKSSNASHSAFQAAKTDYEKSQEAVTALQEIEASNFHKLKVQYARSLEQVAIILINLKKPANPEIMQKLQLIMHANQCMPDLFNANQKARLAHPIIVSVLAPTPTPAPAPIPAPTPAKPAPGGCAVS